MAHVIPKDFCPYFVRRTSKQWVEGLQVVAPCLGSPYQSKDMGYRQTVLLGFSLLLPNGQISYEGTGFRSNLELL